jgi:DNA helicase HerA-like ATPase
MIDDHVPPASLPERLSAARRTAEARFSLEAVAFSTDGRAFEFRAPMDVPFSVGAYVRLDTPEGSAFLGQIVTDDVTSVEGPTIRLTDDPALEGFGLGDLTHVDLRVPVRRRHGSGTILARLDETGPGDAPERQSDGSGFAEATLAPASVDELRRFFARRLHGKAALELGTIDEQGQRFPARINASGFNRHTFLCGQSGSGKTYSLGVVLEQLLLETTLRLIIIDPNADFVHLHQVRPASEFAANSNLADQQERYGSIGADVRIVSAESGISGTLPLRFHFSDLDLLEQGAVLRLDPVADREEFSAFQRLATSLSPRAYSPNDLLDLAARGHSSDERDLRLRIDNLGVAGWDIWADADEPSVVDRLGVWRAIVFDMCGLDRQAEKAIVSTAILEHFWNTRQQRHPVLIVIDEAHNVCPAAPTSELQAAAVDYAIRIAAEGRKFGIHLLLASQRPDKIHRQILSQCDNLILMRMNADEDLRAFESLFFFVPPTLLAQSRGFRQGEALIAGGIVPSPQIVQFGQRLTPEGGSDVPTTWARLRTDARLEDDHSGD